MIPPYPPEPRYGDAWKNLKDAMHEAYTYELLQKIGKGMNNNAENIISATESEN